MSPTRAYRFLGLSENRVRVSVITSTMVLVFVHPVLSEITRGVITMNARREELFVFESAVYSRAHACTIRFQSLGAHLGLKIHITLGQATRNSTTPRRIYKSEILRRTDYREVRRLCRLRANRRVHRFVEFSGFLASISYRL